MARVINSSEWWDSMVPNYQKNQDYRDRPMEYEIASGSVCGPVLEIGPAFGEFCKYLPEQIHYMGMDISQRLVEEARKRYPSRLFVRADILKLGTAQWAKAFGSTCAFQVLEHFSRENLHVVLRKIVEMTRHRLIFSVPRGLPSPSQQKHDGHLIGWKDEEQLREEFAPYGEITFTEGQERHLCGVLAFE
jgi:trans-aconitate methyltransferase